MSQEATYSIGKLAEAAGVTTRTIRYYTAEGLLPPPNTQGRYACYGEAHFWRLQLIQKLKAAFLPLHAIKAQLDGLSDTQIQIVLAGLASSEEKSSQAEGLEPIQQLLRVRPTPSPELAEREGYLSQLLTFRPPNSSEELPVVVERPKRILLISPLLASFMMEAERPKRILLVSPNLAPASEYLSPHEDTSTFTLDEDVAETWKRIPLIPGAELHVRLPDSPDACDRLNRLIHEVQHLFKIAQP